MDSGTGGANDNLFYGNDVSYATGERRRGPPSAATRSSRIVPGQRVRRWGGYSFQTEIVGNDFRGKRTGIAIEHGQENVIGQQPLRSRLDGDPVCGRSSSPSDWGYPKHTTRGAGLSDRGNESREIGTSCTCETRWAWIRSRLLVALCRRLFSPRFAGPSPPFAGRDRSAIIVDEWGPYNWESPKLWPVDSPARSNAPRDRSVLPVSGDSFHFVIATLSRAVGRIGDTIDVVPRRDSTGDWEIMLESGGARFSYARFEPRIDWSVRFMDSSG